jgi:telomerase reverse transcriptase
MHLCTNYYLLFLYLIRKSVWRLIARLSLRKFASSNMQKIEKIQASSIANSFPFAKLRILPKKGSFRPLMTFFRKGKESPLSLNQFLNDTHHVLRGWKNKGVLGFAVFDNRQISEKLIEFKNEWTKFGRPFLNFATIDIQKCYDNIIVDDLLEMLENSPLLVLIIHLFL